MLDDDNDFKSHLDIEEDDIDCFPEWADVKANSAHVDIDQTSYLMLRMSSHFLAMTQPLLEKFAFDNAVHFFHSNINSGTSMHSLRQFDIYKEYTDIFEKSMQSFLEEYSKEVIVEALKTASAKEEDGRESMGTIMLDYISALSNFEEFYSMMEEEAQQSDGKDVLHTDKPVKQEK